MDPPPTAEGWYVLHDLRTVDWDAWEAADADQRERAVTEGVEYLERHAAVEDADAGATAVFSVVGHKADLLVLHLRPTVAAIEAAERRLDRTALARYLEQPTSYLSVTEIGGYSDLGRAYIASRTDADVELPDGVDPDAIGDGLIGYMESRLYPELPATEHVCFYPMDKRRGPDHNWYDLAFEERAEMMDDHGVIGRRHGAQVTQIISGSIGFDDHEWGVTLFADDPTAIKDLLYEMRFDPSTSRYAEFGRFYFGRRFRPAHLERLLAGEAVPTYDTEADAPTDAGARPSTPPVITDGDGSDDPAASTPAQRLTALDLSPERLGLDVDAETTDADGSIHAVLVESEATVEDVTEAVDGLRGNFEHYDSHRGTTVHGLADSDGPPSTVVLSGWATASAADTAAGFLAELPGTTTTSVGPLPDDATASASGGGGAPGGDADERGGASPTGGGAGDHPHGSTDPDADTDTDPDTSDDRSAATDDDPDDDAIREELRELGIYAGQPSGEEVYALVLYSEADPDTLIEAVTELRGHYDRYDSHVKTAVYTDTDTDDDADPAVVSIWRTADAADTAADSLSELPGIVGRAEADGTVRAADGTAVEGGFGTMGMFYTVKPEHREEFVDRFGVVEDLLEGMEGHRHTDLLANVENDADMFIASRWRSKADAMGFFSSEDFRDTVRWGREVLADRPRHVFLA